jgi:hypothetical protein
MGRSRAKKNKQQSDATNESLGSSHVDASPVCKEKVALERAHEA